MEYSITGNEDAKDLTMPTIGSGVTTTLPSDAPLFSGLTVSDSVKSESTVSDSTLSKVVVPKEGDTPDMERFATEWVESFASHTQGFSVSQSTDTSPTKSSTDGSNGPSQEEVER